MQARHIDVEFSFDRESEASSSDRANVAVTKDRVALETSLRCGSPSPRIMVCQEDAATKSKGHFPVHSGHIPVMT